MGMIINFKIADVTKFFMHSNLVMFKSEGTTGHFILN